MNKNGQNGTAASNGSTLATKETQIVKLQNGAVKPEEKKPELPKIEGYQVTLKSQKERTQNLIDLFEKEDKLSSSRATLKSFHLGADEETSSLELRDTKGKTFRTGNPLIIAEVIKLLELNITSKLTDVQTKILSI